MKSDVSMDRLIEFKREHPSTDPSATTNVPPKMQPDAASFPATVTGTTSPYPTVVMLTVPHHQQAGIVSKPTSSSYSALASLVKVQHVREKTRITIKIELFTLKVKVITKLQNVILRVTGQELTKTCFRKLLQNARAYSVSQPTYIDVYEVVFSIQYPPSLAFLHHGLQTFCNQRDHFNPCEKSVDGYGSVCLSCRVYEKTQSFTSHEVIYLRNSASPSVSLHPPRVRLLSGLLSASELRSMMKNGSGPEQRARETARPDTRSV
ncbi:hypothetical protein DNTS_008422 [Danionella cerebrum]|uniref:Uncharacterized protein n=1 Tax=Danionella cerebrum TaxID=2873325 RepID=A0A553P5J8_9TELE|nr:hypothetical protein DNTS_008422 [Danionella translucida]